MTIVAADVDRMLLDLSDSEKQRAFVSLARMLFPAESTQGLTPIELRNENDQLIGYYVAFPEIDPEDFPTPSREFKAELERRTAEGNETVPIDEFMSTFTSRSMGDQDGHKSSQRK